MAGPFDMRAVVTMHDADVARACLGVCSEMALARWPGSSGLRESAVQSVLIGAGMSALDFNAWVRRTALPADRAAFEVAFALATAR